MSDASRLVKAMQKVSEPKQNEVVDIVVGTVTSINPLKVKVDKIVLTESFLILGALCKSAKLPATNTLLWRGLIIGDEVYMIKCARGQKYYILQRKEGIS